MIEGLKPYQAYKNSGLPWLGQIPSHWELSRCKSIFQPVDIRSTTGKEELLTVSSALGVILRRNATVTMFKAESYSGYKLCWPGDLVINSLWAWAGGLGVSQHHGIVSSAYGVYRIRKGSGATPSFVDQVVRSSPFNWELHVRSKGIWTSRLQLTDESFFQAPFHLPPTDEQSAIVCFLNHASARIERAIGAKKKLISLLNEKRQSIIHRAVTRGLDPNVQLKPSGIPWLGQIPEHWPVISLRMRYSVELGKMLDAKRITGRHSVPYLRNRDVQWDQVLTHDLPHMDIAPTELARYTVRTGDLLVCEGGQVGRSAFWNERLPVCGYQKALHRVRSHDSSRDFPRLLFYQIQLAALGGVFEADGNENTFAHLTCEKLRRNRFPFPPFEEQKAIAERLDKELTEIQVTIATVKQEIELFREYRTRLVADVVTGRHDVRNAAASLQAESRTGPEQPVSDDIGAMDENELLAE